MKKYFLINTSSSSFTGFCLLVLADIMNNLFPFTFIFISLQICIVFSSLIYFLSWESLTHFSVVVLVPISTAFPGLLHPFWNRIHCCMQHSGCDRAVALGRGVKVLSVLVLVPFLRIPNVMLISLNTTEPWAGSFSCLHLFQNVHNWFRDGHGVLLLSFPMIQPHLLTAEFYLLIKMGWIWLAELLDGYNIYSDLVS